MNIIVKNIKMLPKSCKGCKIACEPYLSLDGLLAKLSMEDSVRSDCPLIEVPSVDVEEVERGRWIKTVGENGVTSACRCSNCGFGDNRYSLFKYCPICGARMDSGT